MRRALLIGIAGSSLLMLTVTAGAQDRDRDEGRYHEGARDASWWHGRLFDRVREDLDHVQASTPRFSGDQYRLVKVKHELTELQGKYNDHGYDPGAMDDVIGSLQRVVSDNTLSGRDRDMLNDDLNHLREFRDHHEGYR